MMHPKEQEELPSNLILAHDHVDVLAVWCMSDMHYHNFLQENVIVLTVDGGKKN